MMTLNRETPPALHTIDSIGITQPNSVLTTSGKVIYTLPAQTHSILRIDALFKAGKRYSQNPSVPVLANSLLNKGTISFSSKEIAEKLDFYGVYIESNVGNDYARVSFYMLDKFFEQVFPVIQEILQKPVYPKDELELVVKKAKQKLKISKEKVKVLASREFMSTLYKGHPYGVLTEEDNYDAVTVKHLKEFHKEFYKNAEVLLVLSGKVSDRVIQTVGDWYDASAYHDFKPIVTNKEVEFETAQRRVCKTKSDASQTALKIGGQTISKSHRDYTALVFVNTILGGYFGSRLIRNIREEKGYTYGIYSSVLSMVDASALIISSEVNARYTQQAIEEVFKEIRKLQTEKVSDEELQLVRNYMTGSLLQQFDGSFSLAENFINLQKFNLDYRYYTRLIKTINTITKDEIIRIANTYFDEEKLLTVAVGKC